MSRAVHYEYGTSLCTVQENQKLVVEDCDPVRITDELRAANFTRQNGKYVKTRSRLRAERGDSDDGLQVLTVRVIDDTLHVEASDVVGLVGLVPGMSVQVEPKVEWDEVIEMLLTFYDLDRSERYYGVPLDDFVSSGVKASRIVAILAINYVTGLRRIRRDGFVRDLNIRRRDGFEGLGSVDVEKTLMNHATGNPEPTWVETEVRYDNSVNAAIHMAGKLLLRLLQQGTTEFEHPRRDLLLSMVHQEVEHMEHLGIESSQRDVGVYRRLSLGDLPRQRHYYRRAFNISQSILSSTLLGEAGSGPEELLVDYALSMNSLFQDYSQKILEQKLEEIRGMDYLDQLDDVVCKPEKSLYAFAGDFDGFHEPDHLLIDGSDTLAVLDSKYYREGANPAIEGGPRSRMFAYAYLTQTDRMAFLCPHYRNIKMPVKYTGGEIEIVSPDDGFTCEEYERRLRGYLLETLSLHHPELRVFEAVKDGFLSLSGVSERDLTGIHDTSGPFSISNPTTFADKVISAIVFSAHGPSKPELGNGGSWTKDRIKNACNKQDEGNRPIYPQHETTCVPVYDADGNEDTGTVTLYFLTTEDGQTVIQTEGSWNLL
jgi:hypothetical protein